MIKVIYETDIGNDVDDVLALSLIHSLVRSGECELLAVSVNKDNFYAAALADVINYYNGFADVPVGLVRHGFTRDDGFFAKKVVTAEKNGKAVFLRSVVEPAQYCESVSLLRRTLAAAEDNSVAIISTGFFTNLARLLLSGPDEFSALDGMHLAAKKVKLLSCMCGVFSDAALARPDPLYAEYNVWNDLTSAQIVARTWPGEVVFSGWEIGSQIEFPADKIVEANSILPLNPVVMSYLNFKLMPYNRPTWDLTSVLAAARPETFEYSEPGMVNIDNDALTGFTPQRGGKHRYLKLDKRKIDSICNDMVQLSLSKVFQKRGQD
jgi:inosine-uridine nucleoside N-ribohydrolase